MKNNYWKCTTEDISRKGGNVKMTHKDYLEGILDSKRWGLKEIEIQHRIFIAEHEVKTKMLRESINSIERQLQDEEKIGQAT